MRTVRPIIAAFVLLITATGFQPAFFCGPARAQQESAAVQQNAAPQERTAVQSATLGATGNVHQCGNLFFSGQFQPADVAALKAAGIKRVVTFRNDQEIDFDEQRLLAEADIELVKFSFGSPEGLTDQLLDDARALMRDQSQTTLLHCGLANRVGGVWLTHRVLDENVPVEDALAEAAEIGLRAPWIREKAIDYITRKSKESAGGEASVKPGINDRFLSDDLNVDQFIERFELESREIFASREQVIQACGIQPGEFIADVGAGTGLFTRMFAGATGADGWVFAVDIAPRFIEHINRTAAEQNLNNVTGVLGAENSINLPPASVDVIFVCDTYHHFEYPRSTMQSIHRALKPGGRLIVIDFERIEGTTREWVMGHVRAGKEVFRGEIQDAGFTLAEEKTIEGFTENYFLIFRKDG